MFCTTMVNAPIDALGLGTIFVSCGAGPGAKWRAPIRAGIAGSSPDLAPGPAPAREMRQKVPALQNFQLLLPVAA